MFALTFAGKRYSFPVRLYFEFSLASLPSKPSLALAMHIGKHSHSEEAGGIKKDIKNLKTRPSYLEKTYFQIKLIN